MLTRRKNEDIRQEKTTMFQKEVSWHMMNGNAANAIMQAHNFSTISFKISTFW